MKVIAIFITTATVFTAVAVCAEMPIDHVFTMLDKHALGPVEQEYLLIQMIKDYNGINNDSMSQRALNRYVNEYIYTGKGLNSDQVCFFLLKENNDKLLLSIVDSLKNNYMKIKYHTQLGGLYLENGDTARALQQYKRATEYIGTKDDYIASNNIAGLAYGYLEINDTINAFRNAKIADSLDRTELNSKYLRYLRYVKCDQDTSDFSIDYSMQTIDGFSKYYEMSQAFARTNLAIYCYKNKRHDKARQLIRKTIEIENNCRSEHLGSESVASMYYGSTKDTSILNIANSISNAEERGRMHLYLMESLKEDSDSNYKRVMDIIEAEDIDGSSNKEHIYQYMNSLLLCGDTTKAIYIADTLYQAADTIDKTGLFDFYCHANQTVKAATIKFNEQVPGLYEMSTIRLFSRMIKDTVLSLPQRFTKLYVRHIDELINNNNNLTTCLSDIVTIYANTGNFNKAFYTVKKIKDTLFKMYGLIDIDLAYRRLNKKPTKRELLLMKTISP